MQVGLRFGVFPRSAVSRHGNYPEIQSATGFRKRRGGRREQRTSWLWWALYRAGPYIDHPRSAQTGSVRVARHAGTTHATRDAAQITTNADPNASGSRGLTLYKR